MKYNGVPSTPLQVVIHRGSIELLRALLALPNISNDDDRSAKITQRCLLHGAVVSCSPEKVEAVLACRRLHLKHMESQAAVPPIAGGPADPVVLSGLSPVALLVVLPLVQRTHAGFTAEVASQRTSMLRLLLRHEAELPDFDAAGPLVSLPGGEMGIIKLAAYMCHALPMHSMLVVRPLT